MSRMKRKYLEKIEDVFTYVLLIIFALISCFPFYWMMVGSTNTSGKLFTLPITLTMGDQLATNFQNLNQSIDVGRIFFNTLFVSAVATILSVLVATLMAYALAFYDFKFKKIIFGLMLGSMMIPAHVMLVPLFQMMAKYDLLNSYTALIAPSICSPFAIFLMRQNLIKFPVELIEASRLDGAGEFYIFSRIILPNMKPALAATSIFMFMNNWNNFTWPLVAISDTKMYTIPLALASMVSVSDTDYGRLMLAITLGTVPIIILFLALQRHFISGMMSSGIK